MSFSSCFYAGTGLWLLKAEGRLHYRLRNTVHRAGFVPKRADGYRHPDLGTDATVGRLRLKLAFSALYRSDNRCNGRGQEEHPD